MSNKATIYFDSDVHEALVRKAEQADTSKSNLVNAVLRFLLLEDGEKIEDVMDRDIANECNEGETIPFDTLYAELKQSGKV